MRFERKLVIRSPEQSTFHLPLAGGMSRFLAMMIDFAATLAIFLIVGFVMNLLRIPMGLLGLSWAQSLFSAFFILFGFVVMWGYHLFFEMFWNGQTPGKRAFQLRVLQLDGSPITFSQSAIRNLLRFIDAMPMFIPLFFPMGYALGACVMWFDARNRRLGDLAAGTVVVKQERYVAPTQIKSAHASFYNTFREQLGMRRRFQQVLEKAEKELLLDLALRSEQLSLDVRFPIMQALSAHLQTRLRFEKPDFMSDEKFVLNVADALVAEEEDVLRVLGRPKRESEI
ncbi:MAG: hypothetical protein CL920_17060 [Deltaproteobacteria bacterium]|nr:hypothetical protein [Deltaproteobacteria bacterium]|tara:strand:- start:551 stop:1402 length:852 start_codon:yes stop_codon:yes gene_type:complete